MKNLLLILLLAKISLLGASHAQAFRFDQLVAVYLDTATCGGEHVDMLPYHRAVSRYVGYVDRGRDVSYKFQWPSRDMSCHQMDGGTSWNSMNVCSAAAVWSAQAACFVAGSAAELAKRRVPVSVSTRACLASLAYLLGCTLPDHFFQ